MSMSSSELDPTSYLSPPVWEYADGAWTSVTQWIGVAISFVLSVYVFVPEPSPVTLAVFNLLGSIYFTVFVGMFSLQWPIDHVNMCSFYFLATFYYATEGLIFVNRLYMFVQFDHVAAKRTLFMYRLFAISELGISLDFAIYHMKVRVDVAHRFSFYVIEDNAVFLVLLVIYASACVWAWVQAFIQIRKGIKSADSTISFKILYLMMMSFTSWYCTKPTTLGATLTSFGILTEYAGWITASNVIDTARFFSLPFDTVLSMILSGIVFRKIYENRSKSLSNQKAQIVPSSVVPDCSKTQQSAATGKGSTTTRGNQ